MSRHRKYDNPLSLGSVHRDRARVALLAGDATGFAEHMLRMETCFRATENPWLIQQCGRLHADAARLGLGGRAAPSDMLAYAPDELDGLTELSEEKNG
jgi:hypothetical protein